MIKMGRNTNLAGRYDVYEQYGYIHTAHYWIKLIRNLLKPLQITFYAFMPPVQEWLNKFSQVFFKEVGA